MRAPCAEAPRASAQTVFQASIDASGTVNARLMPGFRRGSRRSASATSISSAGRSAVAAALEEAVAVGGVVVGRGDEQPAGVLDAVGDHPAQDRVLGHALLGRHRVLDHVAAARVQQAVEAPARALGEVGAVDEHDVEAAQRGVPGDAGAGGAAADHQHLGLKLGTRESYWPGARACPDQVRARHVVAAVDDPHGAGAGAHRERLREHAPRPVAHAAQQLAARSLPMAAKNTSSPDTRSSVVRIRSRS